MLADLSVSIVTYAPDLPILADTLQSLVEALAMAQQAGEVGTCHIFLVDNGPGAHWAETLRHTVARFENRFDALNCRVITGQGNVGYGQGHNLALACTQAEFHLVLNPDVTMDPAALVNSIRFMRQHQDVGLLSPAAEDESGERQFLCKRYPTLCDLALRALAPRWGRELFEGRLRRYEMRERYAEEDGPFDVPIASGCFMFCRRTLLASVGGFSKRYFMYFEDFDLSLRLGQRTRLVYVPFVRIVHAGGGAARKGWRHVLMFARSGGVFFRTHGWKLF